MRARLWLDAGVRGIAPVDDVAADLPPSLPVKSGSDFAGYTRDMLPALKPGAVA